jgi:hypothetical protein
VIPQVTPQHCATRANAWIKLGSEIKGRSETRSVVEDLIHYSQETGMRRFELTRYCDEHFCLIDDVFVLGTAYKGSREYTYLPVGPCCCCSIDGAAQEFAGLRVCDVVGDEVLGWLSGLLADGVGELRDSFYRVQEGSRDQLDARPFTGGVVSGVWLRCRGGCG